MTQAVLDLIDEHGTDALSLAKVAERTGVAAPSLYKHVPSLAELRNRVAIRGVGERTERLTAAVMGAAATRRSGRRGWPTARWSTDAMLMAAAWLLVDPGR